MPMTEAQIQRAKKTISQLDLAMLARLSKEGWTPPAEDADEASFAASYAKLMYLLHAINLENKRNDPNVKNVQNDVRSDVAKMQMQKIKDIMSDQPASDNPATPSSTPKSKASDLVELQKKVDNIDVQIFGTEKYKGNERSRDPSLNGRINFLRYELAGSVPLNERRTKKQQLRSLINERSKLVEEKKAIERIINLSLQEQSPNQPQQSAPAVKPEPADPKEPAKTNIPMPKSTAPEPVDAPTKQDPPKPLPPNQNRERRVLKEKQYEMADPKAAAAGLQAIVSIVNANPAYAATYPIFESLLNQVVNETPNMYKKVPKLRDAFRYMKDKHPRLYKQIDKFYMQIEDGISPPKMNIKQTFADRVRKFLDPEEPEVFETPERVFRSSKSYSYDQIAKSVSKYVSSLEDAKYPEIDIKLAVLRQFGPGIYNSVYDDAVVVSGRAINASSLNLADLNSVTAKIIKVDRDFHVHMRVGSTRYIAAQDDLDFESIGV